MWRLITGVTIIGLLIAILGALAPVYVENYELGRYVRTLSDGPPEDVLRTEVVTRAHQLDLPVHSEDIQIEHASGKLRMHARYKVKFNLSLYPVDLHMSAP